MKELLHTYEASVQRKDQVISNLTQALSKQREKQDALRTFSDWKIQHIDLKREVSLIQLVKGKFFLNDMKYIYIWLTYILKFEMYSYAYYHSIFIV